MSLWRARALSVAAIALLGGCAIVVPHATEVDLGPARQQYPDLTVDSLEAGRRAYVTRCSVCHALRAPSERPAAEWPKEVSTMARDAHLAPGEAELIERYLEVMASARPIAKR